MKYRYIGNGASLKLNTSACIGCGRCTNVCPHAVFEIESGKAVIKDRGSCMECGACAKNCPTAALSVEAGVGCAAAVLQGMISGGKPDCGCGGSGCCGK
jgi:NAD-dependent dihydropyrimidine dehydrogenase PreA subunit